MSKKDLAHKDTHIVGVATPQGAAAHTPPEPAATGGDGQSKKRAMWRVAYLALPFALAVAVSINTLWNGFAADDQQQVLNNNLIKSLSNIPVAFTTSVWSFVSLDIAMTAQPYYRPMFNALFTINYALFGQSAWGWHLVNVLVHALVAVLVFVLVKDLTGRKELACVTASLFAVHPVHVESVAWVSGITDPLMGLFLLPSFYFYLRYRKGGKNYQAALAAALYFLALLSKETALALLPVVIYCELFLFKGRSPARARALGLAIIAGIFALPTVIYFALRLNVLGALISNNALLYPLDETIMTMPLAAVKYLKLISLPWGYSYQHYTPLVDSVTSLYLIVPVLVLALLAAALVWIKSPELNFAAAWFALTLAPALIGIRYFDLEYLVQERYLYLPSVGFCLAVALAIEWLARRAIPGRGGRTMAAAALALLVLVWGAATVIQNRVWDDTVKVFRNIVAVYPRSAEARASLGITYYFAGRPREAEAESRAAIELDPNCVNGHLNMSFFSKQAGKLDQSIDYLEHAKSVIREEPGTRKRLATLHMNLGLLYAQQKDYSRSEENVLRSVEMWPRGVGWYYAGQFYFNQERYEEALPMYEKTLSYVPPKYAPIYLVLGTVNEKLSRKSEARAAYEKYLELAPADSKDRPEVTRRLQQL